MQRVTSQGIVNRALAVLDDDGWSLKDFGKDGKHRLHSDDYRELESAITRIRNLRSHAKATGRKVNTKALTFSMQDSSLLV